jgi:hypothetical protein
MMATTMIRALTALVLIVAASPASSQQMHVCCSPDFGITRGEAQRWGADERARNERNAREWKAEHPSTWQRFFAVVPVEVDAYDESERKNGKFRYPKVGWVERYWKSWTDEEGNRFEGWKYRLDRSGRSK